MKIVAVIPARYKSSRFLGKPVADINGKPMIWWVYNRVLKVNKIDDVIVATDSDIIYDICNKYHLKVMMTSEDHATSTERVYEVAKNVKSDIYVVINGDEPLVDPDAIEKVIPNGEHYKPNTYHISNIVTKIRNPAEVLDSSNIKIVHDKDYNCIYMSRNPIPYPHHSLDVVYKKHVGILAYNYRALKFFYNKKPLTLEKAEGINELRFIEYGIKVTQLSEFDKWR